MSFYCPLNQEIEEVQFPEEYVDELKEIYPRIIEGMERDGLPIESGTVNVGKLNGRLFQAYFLIVWISENNDVIENLNVVLNDMRTLPMNYVLFPGSPKARFYLLVRTYFHEFYRFREIHNQIVKAAANCGYIAHDEVPLARKAFHDAFQATIELRNTLVHGSPTWKGKDHFDLSMLSMAMENGYAYKDKDTGEIWNIGDTLKTVCNSTADELREEGVRMSKLLKTLVRVYVKTLAKV